MRSPVSDEPGSLSCELFRLRGCPKVVLDKYHWMLYYLVPAMYPRFMITLDEDLKNLPVTVRVGQVRYNLSLSLPLIPKSNWTGRRGCRSSRKATDDLRIPNPHVTCTVGRDGTCGAGHGGIHPIRSRPRGMRYSEKEPWVRGQDGHLSCSTSDWSKYPTLPPPRCNVFWAFKPSRSKKNDNGPVSLCFCFHFHPRA